MSEENTGAVGGFQGSLADAFNPAAGTGCCGSPAANTGADAPAKTAGPCCGTVEEAKAENACCGSQAKTEAVASGTSCCG
ncbi:hypothetical protein [Catenulispora subtropica]|uniref:ACGX-repeat peptide n=1 Tax=Catenulispora subtropica TaxID=450798 RepID=A0ABP5CMI7_9ACTN